MAHSWQGMSDVLLMRLSGWTLEIGYWMLVLGHWTLDTNTCAVSLPSTRHGMAAAVACEKTQCGFDPESVWPHVLGDRSMYSIPTPAGQRGATNRVPVPATSHHQHDHSTRTKTSTAPARAFSTSSTHPVRLGPAQAPSQRETGCRGRRGPQRPRDHRVHRVHRHHRDPVTLICQYAHAHLLSTYCTASGGPAEGALSRTRGSPVMEGAEAAEGAEACPGNRGEGGHGKGKAQAHVNRCNKYRLRCYSGLCHSGGYWCWW